ncbi:MAG: phospho-sugar mutase [Clostridia bacterium]|nr:phospho-sugar mutase [Clostridia bacterium]
MADVGYRENYQKWINSPYVDEKTKAELLSVANNEDELKMRFLAPMEFGTAGQRGIMGAGLARLNVYTVKYTTKALASLVIREGKEAMEKGVVIAYDCRLNSREFGFEAAAVLASNGIKVYIFNELTPTPVLSYAIRRLGATAGINITASHNPVEYNGYKVYWSNGAQLPPDEAAVVAAELKKLDIFTDCISRPAEELIESGMITVLDNGLEREFCNELLVRRINRDATEKTELSVVYTPLHGAGRRAVPYILDALSVKYQAVPEQMIPDGNFPTAPSPNPENPAAFNLALEVAKKEGNKADLLIATDPDADRIGVMAKKNGEYKVISGNQMGVLLLNYMIEAKKARGELLKKSGAISTIVSTPLAEKIAKKNGLEFASTFTGFKFIAEKIDEWQGKVDFLFGFEESFGYMIGDYVRDKDSVGAAMMVSEAAAYYKSQGKTLFDVLDSIYNEYGCYFEKTDNIMMKGIDGPEKTRRLMSELRGEITELGGIKIEKTADFKSGIITELETGNTEPTNMESSNVLKFFLKDGSAVCVRPSGTEPKVKVYYLVCGNDEAECILKTEKLSNAINGIIAD